MTQQTASLVNTDGDTVEKTRSSASMTPMMQQYMAIKEAHKDYLLFYRMGDFYEMFFEDAVTAAKVLDIALTKRGKHLDQDIPMCGVPAHSHESYLLKLIRNGFKVAICEQTEDPSEAKKRGSKAVVKREVIRIITPGTLTEESLLEATSANYLAAFSAVGKDVALAWLDMSTGECCVRVVPETALPSELARLQPKELLIADRLLEDQTWYERLQEWRAILTPQVSSLFDSRKGERRLCEFYQVESLDGFGQFSKGEIGALGALIEYVELTQKGQVPRLSVPIQSTGNQFMVIDAATRKNLELTHTLSGEYKGSLLSVINHTVTGPGARLLFQYLNAPLLDVATINQRLDMVTFFHEHLNVREKVRDALKQLPDMERALSRLYLHRGGPRDLAAIRDGLHQLLVVAECLEFSDTELPVGLRSCLTQLGSHDALRSELTKALQTEVAIQVREGGFIAEGYDPQLDMLRNAGNASKVRKQELQEEYRQKTGIDTLKIKDNNVIGMYIEVTSRHMSKMTEEPFIHRQSTQNAGRYTTPELKTLESDLLNAEGKALGLELELFSKLTNEVLSCADALSLAANALATIDVMASFAELAMVREYHRPEVDTSLSFDIVQGRHPVVEVYQVGTDEPFIRNDCDLSEAQRLWLLTGPNMAGKSTFLRQNAIIALLAQMGSFVPAERAHIGLVDRLFTRVGAADDLSKGRSTFMVEMVETATIINQATNRSLVILDEIGRGTATYDGLSIAWAVVEHLHEVNACRGLFATHYHELTALVSALSHLACYTMKVKEWEDKVIFLHEVVSGTADRSYGIYVAKLAGLPDILISRAKEVLHTLEKNQNAPSCSKKAKSELPLFVATQEKAVDTASHELIDMVKALKPDELSPREALELLYTLQSKV